MSSQKTEEEELTEEQKAHIAVLRRKFFRGVAVFSVFFTIVLLIILRFTVYNHKSVEDYAQYLDHKDKFMRFNAAKALGDFKDDPEAGRVLTQMLNDPAREVRWHAAASLSKIKDPKSVPVLLKVLENEKDVSAKSIYIYTLGQIKDQRAVSPLAKILNSENESKNEENKIILFSTIQALAAIDSEASREALINFENKESSKQEFIDFSQKMRKNKGIVPEKQE